MAELIPAPFDDLVRRLYREPKAQQRLFELPRTKWWLPGPSAIDMSTSFHGTPAGNPSGPAAGPHTQMAQNLLLSYVAGGRILELKTVQIKDRLTIPRPCIDMTNVGYNVEWSQELCVEDSLREYTAGAMLIEMFRHSAELSDNKLMGPVGDVIYDISVGYDLAGIKSEKVCAFLRGMRDANTWVSKLRSQIPHEYRHARDLDYPTRLSTSVTLSTFHGCPVDEIASIGEFLVAEFGFDVIVKMNPPTLGRERLEHLLYDVMGYHDLCVNPKAYSAAATLDESVSMCNQLIAFAKSRGRRAGFKFSNTLEVVNHRDFFTRDNEIMYLSGQPLHVISMALTNEFRQRMGPYVPISFSAGIDRHNFPLAVACGFVPITSSTDLLRPGGYGRLKAYLDELAVRMEELNGHTSVVECGDSLKSTAQEQQHTGLQPCPAKRGSAIQPFPGGRGSDLPRRCAPGSDSAGQLPTLHSLGVRSIDDYILKAFGKEQEARQRAVGELGQATDPVALDRAAVAWAGLLNTQEAAKQAEDDQRYRAPKNRKVPKRIDSRLETFDCITCDKCLPVCPNAANFKYPTPIVDFVYHDLIVTSDGSWWFDGEERRFSITQELQIACYANFCNECGNCDTFCPEYGGPYIEKPSFFSSVASWTRAAPRDGFVVKEHKSVRVLTGRIKGVEYELEERRQQGVMVFSDGFVRVTCSTAMHQPEAIEWLAHIDEDHKVDLWVLHTMRYLLAGVLDARMVNQVNSRY